MVMLILGSSVVGQRRTYVTKLAEIAVQKMVQVQQKASHCNRWSNIHSRQTNGQAMMPSMHADDVLVS